MPKLVCVKCEVELVIHKSGATVIPHFSNPPRPYQIYQADVWKCPKCETMIVAGFANQPLAEHYERNFDQVLDDIVNAPNSYIINDFEYPPIE